MSDALSSDILEDQFGPTKLTVLWQNGMSRIICTEAAATKQVLEVSLVTFAPLGVKAFQSVHKAVSGGASMGKAFRKYGVSFQRRTRGVYPCPEPALPPEFARIFNAAGRATVVAVTILAGPSGVPYADILEVYSPAVSWPEASTGSEDELPSSLGTFGALLRSLYTETMGMGGSKDGSRNQVGKAEGPVSKRPRT